MRIRRLLIALSAGVALLVACAPVASDSPREETPPPEETEDPEPPQWPMLAATPAAGVEGLDTSTISDNDSQIHVVVPQLEGHDPFNERLQEWAEELVEGFTREFVDTGDADDDGSGEPSPEGDDDAATLPWLSATWGVTAIGDLIGVVLDDTWSPGASVTSEQNVLWYDPEAGKFISWQDLLTEEAREALPELLVEGLKDSSEQIRTGDIDVEMLTALMDDDDLSVGFTADGGLVVTFDGYSVLAGSYGSPAVAFPPEETRDWLTETGEIALESTLDPDVSGVPEEPEVIEPEQVDCEETACVALTFDDGPGGSTTPELLGILDEEGVPGTFFMLGSQARSFPGIVADVAEAGHEIASHTWSHPSLPSLGQAGIQDQLERTSGVLESITGSDVTLLRPPYGATDDVVAEAAEEAGLAQVLWSIDTRDWEHQDPKKTIAEAKKAEPGAIILMHDIHPTTIEAVPGVIEALREEGLTFVTVSNLLGETAPGQEYSSR